MSLGHPVVRYSVMGWLRSVGSIKLSVSFAEYRLFYRSLLKKRPIILSILLNQSHPMCRCGWEYCDDNTVILLILLTKANP